MTSNTIDQWAFHRGWVRVHKEEKTNMDPIHESLPISCFFFSLLKNAIRPSCSKSPEGTPQSTPTAVPAPTALKCPSDPPPQKGPAHCCQNGVENKREKGKAPTNAASRSHAQD